MKAPDTSEKNSVNYASNSDERISLHKEMCLLFQRIKDFELFESNVNELKLKTSSYVTSSTTDIEQCFDANQCIKQLVCSMQKRFPAHKQIKLRLSNIPATSHSEFNLRRVLYSLLLNAMQASTPDQQVTVSTQAKDGLLFVDITDVGCGISTKNLKQVFSPFYTTKKGKRGTGLGLAISQQIIYDYGGSISLNSSVNLGTRLCIKLPLSNWYLH